jgi:hypothetical protein
MLTGKTIAQLDLLTTITDNTLIPVELDGNTYHVQYSSIKDDISNQGSGCTTTGLFSQAEGLGTNANGNFSHSEGTFTNANGDFSHSEGFYSTSSGLSSHAEGQYTNSSGDFSHAEGLSTNSVGYGSHSEGSSSVSIGNSSHSEGYGTTAGWKGFNVYSVLDNVITIDSGGVDLTSEFTSGRVILDGSIYNYSSTTFSGSYFTISLVNSLNNAVADSFTYTAIDPTGFGNIFTGSTDDTDFSIELAMDFDVEFFSNTYSSVHVGSNGYLTFGGGYSNCCINEPEDIPSVVGYPGIFLSIQGIDGLLYTLSTGFTNDNETFVIRYEGTYRNIPSGSPDLIYNYLFYRSVPNLVVMVIESNPIQNGTDSGVSDAKQTSYLATFDGSSNKAYAISTNGTVFTHVADLQNLNSVYADFNTEGSWSHSEGFANAALGVSSHAEGSNTFAIGDYSHTEGLSTEARGAYSHTEGIGTVAYGVGQHVSGKFNTTGNTNSLFIIGNGTGTTYRSDVVLVDTTGMTVSGVVKVLGISEYANNAAAIAGGLTVGDLYRDGDTLKIVH